MTLVRSFFGQLALLLTAIFLSGTLVLKDGDFV